MHDTLSKKVVRWTHVSSLSNWAQRLALQLGVYSTKGKGEHLTEGGHPDQWPADLNVQEYSDPLTVTPWVGGAFNPAYDLEACMHFGGENAKVS